MKRVVNGAVLILVVMLFALAGCGKRSGIEGKVVDGKGKPMAGVKLIAKQVEPIKGYEQFETKTGSDGTFRFDKLYPFADYIINGRKIFTTGDEKTIKVALTVRFIRANGVVTDTKTGLMWAARDNGKDINWSDAKTYCENYKDGGFNDWRLPTQDELAELYKAGIRYRKNQIISLSACCPWASEIRGSSAAFFRFGFNRFFFGIGRRLWAGQYGVYGDRALPVRGGK